MITIGSLFSGVGGLELGLEAGLSRAGWESRTLFQVEQAVYPRAVLARHWPHAKRYADVHDITLQNTEPVDLICGGFPCQDISTAGKGAGLAGERSGLFFEMARIIRELRPRVVVMENVPALNTRGLDVVLGTLAALGYDARWGGLRASEVGAPHRRERWFCVAWLADSARERRRGLGEHQGLGHAGRTPTADRSANWAAAIGRGAPFNPDDTDNMAHPMCITEKRRDTTIIFQPARINEARQAAGYRGQTELADSSSRRQPGSGRTINAVHSTADREWQTNRADDERRRQTQPVLGRDPAGIPARLDAHRWPAPPGPQHPWEPPRTRPRQPHDRDRLKALGNAVVPQCAAIIGEYIGRELCTTSE